MMREFELIADIGNINESKICIRLRQRILSNLGPYLYVPWFSLLDFVENEDEELECYDENASINEDATAYANTVLKQVQRESPKNCDDKD
jgi:hypothetical protein